MPAFYSVTLVFGDNWIPALNELKNPSEMY